VHASTDEQLAPIFFMDLQKRSKQTCSIVHYLKTLKERTISMPLDKDQLLSTIYKVHHMENLQSYIPNAFYRKYSKKNCAPNFL
jgi:hypothetical protein